MENSRTDEMYNEYLNEKLKNLFVYNVPDSKDAVSVVVNNPSSDIDAPLFTIEKSGYGPGGGDFGDIYTIKDGDYEVESLIDRDSYYNVEALGAGLYVKEYHKSGQVFVNNRNGKTVFELNKNMNFSLMSNRYYHNGLIAVVNGTQYNYVNTKGKLLFPNTWFKKVSDFKYGYAIVQDNNSSFHLIDTKGTILFTCAKEEDISITPFFITGPNIAIPNLINHNNYKVRKKLLNDRFVCKRNDDYFETSFMPFRIYSPGYCLGINGNHIFIFDRFRIERIDLGLAKDIEYSNDNNLIINKKTGMVYYVYGNKLLEISAFYHQFLKGRKIVQIKDNIGEILTKNEFKNLNNDEIKKALEEEKERQKQEKEQEEKNRKDQEIKRLKEELQREKEKILQFKKEQEERSKNARKKIEEGFRELRENKGSSVAGLIIEDLFIKVGGHREFSSLYINNIKIIDLSYADFTNVKVSGIDFCGTNVTFSNATLNPQTVYNKDLSDCNFEGIFISPFVDFSGVNIKGAKFSVDSDVRTVDVFNNTFRNAIYDENTTYNGIPLVDLLDSEKLKQR